MKQLTLLLSVLLLASCETPVEDTGASAPGTAILALDLEPMARDLRSDGRLPTEIEVRLDGTRAAGATLPAPVGLLDGHLAVALFADRAQELVVHATFADGSSSESAARPVVAGKDEVLRVPVLLESHGALRLGEEQLLALPFGTRLAVEATAEDREPAASAEPASAIARLLREPGVQAVTPYTDEPSPADRVGALVPGERLLAPATGDGADESLRASVASVPRAVAVTATTTPPAATAIETVDSRRVAEAEPAARPDRIVSWRLLRVTFGSPATDAGELLSYYSYCSCARPAPDRAYLLTTPSGRQLAGLSDRFGFVLVDRAAGSRLDFGATQRPRPRSYEYVAGDPASQDAILAALGSAEVNDIVTALLDLRAEPLPEAREALVELLGHDETAVWLNAAVTLSGYEGSEGLARCRLARLGHGTSEAARHIATIGGLRQAAAVEPLLPWLEHEDPEVRAVTAWSLGFIGDARAIAALELATTDPAASVRAEAALAIGRIGGYGSMDGLLALTDDIDPAVARRAREAIDLSTF